MDHICHILTGLIFAGHLFQKLAAADVESRADNAGILGIERISDLAAAGGDGVQGNAAFLLGQLVQLLIRLVGVIDARGLFPFRQLRLSAFRLGCVLGLGGGWFRSFL